jgi:hypothetical protein
MTKQTDQTEPTPRDPIVDAILHCVGAKPSVSPQDVATYLAQQRKKAGDDRPAPWRKYLPAVKQQMVHLARAGEIDILRKGQVADPNDFKGIVRLRKAAPK